jgi:prepilin-type N-terminal cleavage/methylation domain-containing protein
MRAVSVASPQEGFTLAEMLVAFAIIALILAAAGLAFQFGTQTLLVGSEQVA